MLDLRFQYNPLSAQSAPFNHLFDELDGCQKNWGDFAQAAKSPRRSAPIIIWSITEHSAAISKQLCAGASLPIRGAGRHRAFDRHNVCSSLSQQSMWATSTRRGVAVNLSYVLSSKKEK